MLGLLLAFALLAPVRLVAQSGERRPLTREDLEVFLDALVSNELTRGNIAGAIVTVVKDGQVLLSKGFGYSNVERRTPVFPDSTLFRVASISKTFNATAVMQLVEQGKLDLDADIQSYLDFPLPTQFPESVTLRHLLTHTAGFEESGKELPVDAGQTSVELGLLMRRTTPHQIYRPGTITSYSNYGADLAGYVVERVSGLPFEEYIRQHLLEPIGMRHSSFAEPLPPELKRLMSGEYNVASDTAQDFEVIQGEPSGNLSSTGLDMARFMIMHLQLGRYDSTRILADSTARYMATTQFRTHPAVNGMAVGFFEESRDGYRMIGHGGDLSRFHSHMTLLMDEGVGFFLSVNSAGNGGGLFGIREVVIDAFMHRYFPRTTPLEPVLANAAGEARKVVGSYQLSRRGETTLYRVAALSIPIAVAANPDGSIQIPLLTAPNGEPIQWYLIAPMVYRNEDGSMKLGFVADSSGNVTRVGFLGGHELHKTGIADSVAFNYWFAGTCLAIMAATLLLWPLAVVIRKRYSQPLPDDGVPLRLRVVTRATAILAIGLLLSFVVFFSLATDRTIKLNPSIDPVLRLFQLIGLLILLGTAATVVAAVLSWLRGTNRLGRIKYTALALACIGYSWFILHWNILTTNLDF